MAEADSRVAATTAVVGFMAVAAVAIMVAGTAAGMVAMAVGVVGTVDGTEATVAGEAVIRAIPATVTDGDSALVLAGDLTGGRAILTCMVTAQLGLRRIIHIVTLTRTVIPMYQLPI